MCGAGGGVWMDGDVIVKPCGVEDVEGGGGARGGMGQSSAPPHTGLARLHE